MPQKQVAGKPKNQNKVKFGDHHPTLCKGWEEDGWYCGTRNIDGPNGMVHYGGFKYDCIQCGSGWITRGWSCGCSWASKDELRDQIQTRKKHGLAKIRPEFQKKMDQFDEEDRKSGSQKVEKESSQEEDEEKPVSTKKKFKAEKEKGENESGKSNAKNSSLSDLPPCQYGSACYRKNPRHFKEFSHPQKD